MTVDEARGIVFAPTADANRAVPGMNLYCNSILALDANTGKLRWFRQLVHHDVWDMDMPTPPLLVPASRSTASRSARCCAATFQTIRRGRFSRSR
jgi:quinoprotein glucose dehydrogenase